MVTSPLTLLTVSSKLVLEICERELDSQFYTQHYTVYLLISVGYGGRTMASHGL